MNSILLVEDDSVIIKSLTEFLSDEGFSVSHADGQSKAISMMNDLSFDILFFVLGCNGVWVYDYDEIIIQYHYLIDI